MEKPSNPKWDNVKATLWFIAMIEVLIFFLAIISGHVCGYKNSLIGFGILGLLVGSALFLVLITVIAIDLVLRFAGKRVKLPPLKVYTCFRGGQSPRQNKKNVIRSN